MIYGAIIGLIGLFFFFHSVRIEEDTFEDHLEIALPNKVLIPVDGPVYVTVVCGKSAHRYCPFRFRSLQNLIGSLHRYRYKDNSSGLPFVHVFGHRLSPAQLQLLHQWRRVYYHDTDRTFPDLLFTAGDGRTICKGKSRTMFTDGTLAQAVLRRVLGDYTNVVYVDANYLFDSYVGNVLLDLMRKNGRIRALDESGRLVVEAVHRLDDLKISPRMVANSELYAKSPSRDPNYRCSILQRLDIAHSHCLHEIPDFCLDDRTIVLGAPTTSRRTERSEDHPLSIILVPSLVKTAQSNPNWKFVLLLAYDSGDKFLDEPIASSLIRERIQAALVGVDNIQVLLFRVVPTKSVVMIWNLLYDFAMAKGATYFYMVNDDVTFLEHHWPDSFTKAIDKQGGRGIAGPTSQSHGCDMMTQIFIGRGHYKLFGYLFPPDFHNWWCDNWINRIYEKLGAKACFDDIRIRNGGRKDGSRSRYQACAKFDFLPVVEGHLDKLSL